jgi:phosphatidylserine/phosphatidylglycerophosphate/cardiolipin synthase-like enzyme/uncharacterized membrane protein YdjX (TVP38/TMEM64 family)
MNTRHHSTHFATDEPILREGETCWRCAQADRLRFLIDGAAYFHALREALKLARRRVFILGWDINSQLELLREGEHPESAAARDDDLPVALGPLLTTLAETRPELEIHVLNWDYALVYAPDREALSQVRLGWTSPANIHYKVDDCHPAGGCQHQKLVVIDDALAFVGGIDLTLGRWDTQVHRPNDDRRIENGEGPPRPFHDVHLAVAGEAAQGLGRLARERWQRAGGEALPAVDAPPTSEQAWPAAVPVDATALNVAIARTLPAYDGASAVREIEAQLVAALKAARHCIYLENQYLTADCVAEQLAQKLRERGGPEVVIVLPFETDGWLSQYTMDVIRERIIRRLRAEDHEGRLRVFYPHDPALGDQYMIVHSKVTIIDDAYLRIGSANYNNRSMGLDSELDIALEARGPDAAKAREAIALFRDRLLGEHLAVEPDHFGDTLARTGSLIETISALQDPNGHALFALPLKVPQDVDELIPEGRFVDPEQPIEADHMIKEILAQPESRHALGRVALGVGLLLGIAAMAAAWRWTPLAQWLDVTTLAARIDALPDQWYGPVVMVGLIVVSTVLAFPVTLMSAVTILLFGQFFGPVYALTGAVLSAVCAYLLGQGLGRPTVEKIAGRRMGRLERQLQSRGLATVIFVRIVPIAPFTLINMAAGALNFRLFDLLLGTLVGMLPATVVIAVFIDQVTAVIERPDLPTFALFAAVAGALLVAIWGGRKWICRLRDAAVARDA